MRSLLLLLCLLAGFGGASAARSGKPKVNSSIADYIQRVQNQAHARSVAGPGSLWTDSGFGNLASDYRAHEVGDLVIIRIVEQTLAEADGSVSSQRTFGTNSAITGIAGRINTAGVNPVLAASSDTKLQGKAQAASNSRLQTSVSGRVMAVLGSGNLVVEARRELLMNNERQMVFLRGVARPGDIGADNAVLSTELSDLEVELRGKGVVSDATRRPHWLTRALLWLVSF